MSEINERIQLIIADQGIKKIDFANALGITSSSVSTMCSGKSNPSPQTKADICRFYNVNRQWLETGEGEMYVPLSRDEEILRLTAALIKPSEEPEKQEKLRTFVSTISQLNYDELEVLYKIAKSWVDKNEQA